MTLHLDLSLFIHLVLLVSLCVCVCVCVCMCVFFLVAAFYLSLYVAQETRRTAGFGVSIRSCAGQPRHLSQQGLLNLSVCQWLGLCKHHTALRDKHTHMTFLTLNFCVGGCPSELKYMDCYYFYFWGVHYNEFGHFKDVLFTIIMTQR